MLQHCISIYFQHLWVIKSNKQQVFKHRLGLKVIRPIAVMTPTESNGQDGVSVTPSYHVSQSQQWLVLPVHYPPTTICPNPQLWLPQTQNPPSSSYCSARQRLLRWEREASDGLISPCLHAKLNNLNYLWRISFFSFFSWCQIRKHACTRQPHYMLFGYLMRVGWKMENVPSAVCLMAGFLSSHHTAGVPGWSRQHPSAGHCRQKTHSLSTRIIIISLYSHCSAAAQHQDKDSRCSPRSKHLPWD